MTISPEVDSTHTDRPIGVFDSGVGGLSVLDAVRGALPREHFVYFADSGHAPYGERDDAFVAERTHAVAQYLVAQHWIKALIVACNTATAAAVHALRADFGSLAVVGIEPALKPAVASTRTGRIAVLATRGTLASRKFDALRSSLAASEREFICVPCDGLAAAIEHFDAARIDVLCERYLREAGAFGGTPGRIDTLVLGCTHYPFAAEALRRCTGPDVRFLDTGEPVAQQTRRLLSEHALLRSRGEGSLALMCTASPGHLDIAARRWLRRLPDRAAVAIPLPTPASV